VIAKLPSAAAWPTPQDYNEALQSPRLSFEDADLQSGTPEVTPLGLPRPITGGFASVYSVRSGGRRWAVRCFLRDFPDHQERYAEIGRHLAAVSLPYTVGFQFLERGIRVRGHWYPVLKMEWIEGATFQETIEANVQNPIALVDFAERWLKMLGALKKQGIAHGDLQHGNVLIAGGDFRLIDYDGMFVPSFAGKTSREVGHRNYQHPARTENDFGPHLDNFSGWAVYITLIALSIDASLWSRFGCGEEHLLFRKDDFEEPRYSRLFRHLHHLKDDRIQKYLPLFRSYLGMSLSSIASPADVVGMPVRKRQPRHVPLPSWSRENQLDLFTPKPAPVPVEDARVGAPVVRSEPVAFVEERSEPVTFRPPVAAERILLSSYAALMVTVIGFAAYGNLPGLDAAFVVIAGFGSVGVSLLVSYLALEQVRSKAVLWIALEVRRNRYKVAESGVVRMSDWIPRLELRQSQRLRRLATKDADYVLKEKDRIVEVKRTLASWIGELNARKAELDRAEAAEALQPLVTKERTLLSRRYELERRSVRRSQAFARAAARNKILNLHRRREQQHKSLDLKRAAMRDRFERRKNRLQRVVDRSTNWINRERLSLGRQIIEMDRHREIRFSKYARHILGIS
jgi:hypothetical protein